MKRVALAGLFAASVLSCSGTTGPVATVSAIVTRVTTAPGSVDALLDVELTNTSSMEISLAPCGGVSLDRQNPAGEWDQVWSPPCLVTSTDIMIIPAGSSRTLTTRITATGNGDTWPGAGLDGTYRLRFHIFPPDAAIKRMARVTNLISATPVVSNEFVFLARL